MHACLIVGVLAGLSSGALGAQPARAPLSTSFPWWVGPLKNTLNLSEAQTKQIHTTIADYRDRLFELRSSVNSAETELQNIFNEDPVDQRKAEEAIGRLTEARGELTKTISEMSLKLRTVLTAQQWQDLQERQRERISERGVRRRKGNSRGVLAPDAKSAPAAPPK